MGSYTQQPSQGYATANVYSQQAQSFAQPYGTSGSSGSVPYGQMPMLQGRAVYAPAGLIIPITLTTSISTQVANVGDLVQAKVSQDVALENGVIPANSVVTGQVTDSLPGRFMSRSGLLTFQFTSLQLPDGSTIPINGHLVGGIGQYAESDGTLRGEGMGTKVEQIGLRSLLGAGGGAALGTAIGAIAGGGHGAGMGAWSGTAIGGGGALLEGVFLRKGRNVLLRAGTPMRFQLDAPITITAGASGPSPYVQQPYSGNF